ncbi:MAG TPA: tetratricopeptide repeat protein [Bryobacteraceae bacterium]|nr:tetratricopeptide repeat protein [Bryobacteraceae bacterium]
MSANRLEMLQTLVEQNPTDTFVRYGLAMEYTNSGKLEEAVSEFETLLKTNGEYAAAYFHGGQALERLGRVDEARVMYERGIEVTARSGDRKTQNELQAALDMLPL